jgi:hypothetical protein
MLKYRSGRKDSHKVCPLPSPSRKQGGPRRRGTDRATDPAGHIKATCSIFRQTGAAVPILIYAWRSGYVPVKIKVEATTN